mmetsp:Transcript_24513/g.60571  ORF Transcript_24513/g.60571 Transcript_24513/m.60571 type:complete len:273 (-) Transcript_24513:80-898(-)
MEPRPALLKGGMTAAVEHPVKAYDFLTRIPYRPPQPCQGDAIVGGLPAVVVPSVVLVKVCVNLYDLHDSRQVPLQVLILLLKHLNQPKPLLAPCLHVISPISPFLNVNDLKDAADCGKAPVWVDEQQTEQRVFLGHIFDQAAIPRLVQVKASLCVRQLHSTQGQDRQHPQDGRWRRGWRRPPVKKLEGHLLQRLTDTHGAVFLTRKKRATQPRDAQAAGCPPPCPGPLLARCPAGCQEKWLHKAQGNKEGQEEVERAQPDAAAGPGWQRCAR